MKKILLLIVAIMATFSAYADDLYLKGPGGWGEEAEWKFSTSDNQNFTLIIPSKINNGTEFKLFLKTSNGEQWFSNEATNFKVGTSCTFTGNGNNNMKFAEDIPAGTVFTFNTSTGACEIKAGDIAVNLVGDFNGTNWQTNDAYKFTSTDNENYTLVLANAIPQNSQFKVLAGDGKWYGAKNANSRFSIGDSWTLDGSENVIANENFPVGSVIKFVRSSGMFSVTYTPTKNYTLVGNFGNYNGDHNPNHVWTLVSQAHNGDTRGHDNKVVLFGSWDDENGEFIESTATGNAYHTLVYDKNTGLYSACIDVLGSKIIMRLHEDYDTGDGAKGKDIYPYLAGSDMSNFIVDDNGRRNTFSVKQGSSENTFELLSGIYTLVYDPAKGTLAIQRKADSWFYNALISGEKIVYARGTRSGNDEEWQNIDRAMTVTQPEDVNEKYGKYGVTVNSPILVYEIDNLVTASEFKFGTGQQYDWFWGMTTFKRGLDGSDGSSYATLNYNMWIPCAPLDGENTNMKMNRDSNGKVAILLDPKTWDVMYLELDEQRAWNLPAELYAFVHDNTDNENLTGKIGIALTPERPGSSRYVGMIELTDDEQYISLAANDNSAEHPVNANFRYTPGVIAGNVYSDAASDANVPLKHTATAVADESYLISNSETHYFVRYNPTSGETPNPAVMRAPTQISGKTAKDAKAWMAHKGNGWSLEKEGVPGKYQLVVDFVDNSIGLWRNTDGTTSIDAIDSNATDASARYFNLQGIEVKAPQAGSVYIVNRGGKITKEIMR